MRREPEPAPPPPADPDDPRALYAEMVQHPSAESVDRRLAQVTREQREALILRRGPMPDQPIQACWAWYAVLRRW